MNVNPSPQDRHRLSKPRRLLAGIVAGAFAATSAGAVPLCAEQKTLPGANVAGGEFNAGKNPAVYARDYIYPAAEEIALLKSIGLRSMRMPFLWERIQPQLLGALDNVELERLDQVVKLAKASGIVTILDVHNYGMYDGISLDQGSLPREALPNLWKRLALHFRGDPDVVFGLMNEPKDVDIDAWAAIARSTLEAIRSTSATNVVLVPGTHWDGAHSWLSGPPGHSNGEALLPLARNDSRVVFEIHQYFDDNYSGTSPACGAAGRIPTVLADVGKWARANHVKLFLGEFGVSQQPECVKALDDALAVIDRDRAVWFGWTYWSAGAWWGSYPFNLQASNGDNPQARVLAARAKSLEASACVE